MPHDVSRRPVEFGDDRAEESPFDLSADETDQPWAETHSSTASRRRIDRGI